MRAAAHFSKHEAEDVVNFLFACVGLRSTACLAAALDLTAFGGLGPKFSHSSFWSLSYVVLSVPQLELLQTSRLGIYLFHPKESTALRPPVSSRKLATAPEQSETSVWPVTKFFVALLRVQCNMQLGFLRGCVSLMNRTKKAEADSKSGSYLPASQQKQSVTVCKKT